MDQDDLVTIAAISLVVSIIIIMIYANATGSCASSSSRRHHRGGEWQEWFKGPHKSGEGGIHSGGIIEEGFKKQYTPDSFITKRQNFSPDNQEDFVKQYHPDTFITKRQNFSPDNQEDFAKQYHPDTFITKRQNFAGLPPTKALPTHRGKSRFAPCNGKDGPKGTNNCAR